MKGHEIIRHIARDEMPDLEQVRDACHRQAPARKQSVRPLRWSTAAIFIALCLTFASGIYATVQHFSSFDRLRHIVGDERADTLNPAEAVFDTLDFLTDTGFRGELVAIGVSANVLDLYLTLEDMVENRLDRFFRLDAYLRDERHRGTSTLIQSMEIIDRSDCGIVTLHNRQTFDEPIAEQVLQFTLQDIRYNYRSTEIPVDFDLAQVMEQAPAAQLWDTPILTPYLHDIPIALEGFERAGDIRLSAVGIIDGRLHVQEKYVAFTRLTGSRISLINPDGEIVPPLRSIHNNTASLSFGIDHNGNIYNDLGYNFVFGNFPYRENVFEVDIERLGAYRLVAALDAYDYTELNWTTSFTVETPEWSEFVFGELALETELMLEQYGVVIHEIRISPFAVSLDGSVLPDRYDWHMGLFNWWDADNWWDAKDHAAQPLVRLHTEDGDIINVGMGKSYTDLTTRVFTEVLSIDAIIEDLDALAYIEIAGEMVKLR